MKSERRDRNVMLAILAFLMSVILWFYVMSVENPDSTSNYSKLGVQIEGINQLAERDLVIIDGAQTTVSVKLQGKRDKMVQVEEDKITATISAAALLAINAPGTYHVNYDIALNVPDGVRISTKSPAQITLTVDRIVTDLVPVDLEFSGSLPEGYVMEGYSLSPNALTVQGPETYVGLVKSAKIVRDLSNTTGSTKTLEHYILLDAAGNAINSPWLRVEESSVALNLNVSKQDAIKLVVDVLPSDYITLDMIEYTISPESIEAKGSPDVVSSLNQINLGTVNIKTLLEQDITEITLPVNIPNGVVVENPPGYATVTFNFKGLMRAMLSVNSQAFAPSDKYTYLQDSLLLTLFGREEELAKFSTERVTVTPIFDEGSLVPGENVVPVAVVIDPELEISLIGKYTLTIVVPEPEEGEPGEPVSTEPDGPDDGQRGPDGP